MVICSVGFVTSSVFVLSDVYKMLVDGVATRDLEEFLDSEHTFEDYTIVRIFS